MTAPTGGEALRDGTTVLVGFARALAAAGLPADPDRAALFVRAAAELGVGAALPVYWAGRTTMIADPDQIPVYDAVFRSWFAQEPPQRIPRPRPRPVEQSAVPFLDGGSGDPAGPTPPAVQARASSSEVLRHRDLATLSVDEKREMAAILALLRPGLPQRRSRRTRSYHRGRIDRRRTVRAMLAAAGEPGRTAHRSRRTRPRRIVLLIDVSGSMAAYADALLRFAHVVTRFRPGSVETFTVGTRLTRITRALTHRDPNRALAAVADTVPDFSGGTRLGETLKVFSERWGRRGVARGAVLVLFSDGWERGSPEDLAEQVSRLRRLAHRVVWVNPHKGKQGYAPVQGGIMAVMPHLDDFVAGHSLGALEELLEVIRDA
jgi:uncharacterized protein